MNMWVLQSLVVLRPGAGLQHPNGTHCSIIGPMNREVLCCVDMYSVLASSCAVTNTIQRYYLRPAVNAALVDGCQCCLYSVLFGCCFTTSVVGVTRWPFCSTMAVPYACGLQLQALVYVCKACQLAMPLMLWIEGLVHVAVASS